jgi:hypothetical protein
MPHISTVTGREFDFLQPDTDSVHPFDIAWALSGINRFTGHTFPFYSVAQHAVRVSYSVPKEFALQGLLHDAAEAYIGDISTPLKRAIDAVSNGAFKRFERNVEEVVAAALGVPPPMPPEVKRWDYIDFAIARRDLMPMAKKDWDCTIPPQPKLEVMSSLEAFHAFINRWVELDPSKRKDLLDALRRFRSE